MVQSNIKGRTWHNVLERVVCSNASHPGFCIAYSQYITCTDMDNWGLTKPEMLPEGHIKTDCI